MCVASQHPTFHVLDAKRTSRIQKKIEPHFIYDWVFGGCILGELLLHAPLMPGKTEQQQLELIVALLGVRNAYCVA